ncbi:hypothetical protein Tco_0444143 [Tanacetum coccineum]
MATTKRLAASSVGDDVSNDDERSAALLLHRETAVSYESGDKGLLDESLSEASDESVHKNGEVAGTMETCYGKVSPLMDQSR